MAPAQRTATTSRSGPAPADVVVALRDRVQTLKEMAERAAVWYRPADDSTTTPPSPST